MSTWALQLDTGGTGRRVAVKDLIDMVGLPTGAGSRAVSERAEPASADAACLAGIRAAERRGEVRIVGKTTLHELAYGITGINAWAGTPCNPIAPGRVPGGSSSGSAVAVAAGEADVALGTDSGGSVRIPAACCGIAGLKTTAGRIPLQGVRPLASSFDTVGPMAADVAGLVAGMALLEPGFAIGQPRPVRIGRVHLPAEPVVDRAIDRALGASELEVVEIGLPGWEAASAAALTLLDAEAWAANGELARDHPDALGADVLARLRQASRITEADRAAATKESERWQSSVEALLDVVDVIALPTLLGCPPLIEDAAEMGRIRGLGAPVNLMGLPAVALPVPAVDQAVPASVQLIGALRSEAMLLETATIVEVAAAT